MDKKLRPKYKVHRFDPGGYAGKMYLATDPDDIDSPFVLMPRKDPAAFAAMVMYARMCEPDLAAEIKEWLEKIAGAPTAFGSQGQRNFVAVRLKNLYDIVVR